MANENAWTALCIWEWFLMDEDKYIGYRTYRSDHGVMESRDRAIELAVAADKIWEALREITADDGMITFDYEYVPLFLEHCTNAMADGYIAELKYTGKQTEEGYDEAAKGLAKHWLEDGVW